MAKKYRGLEGYLLRQSIRAFTKIRKPFQKTFGKKYGRKKLQFRKIDKNFENLLAKLNRQALHAKTLGFIHPKTKENVLFDSDIPVDMNSVIEKWRGYSKHKNL